MKTSYDSKPYLGIFINNNGRKYAIPLTSAKEKHKYWQNNFKGRILIYETIDKSKINTKFIYKDMSNGKIKHILAAIIIPKMIPIKEGVYSITDLSDYGNNYRIKKYKNLLKKELRFCIKNKEKILKYTNKIYYTQIKKKKIYFSYCDFKKLESVCDNYKIN